MERKKRITVASAVTATLAAGGIAMAANFGALGFAGAENSPASTTSTTALDDHGQDPQVIVVEDPAPSDDGTPDQGHGDVTTVPPTVPPTTPPVMDDDGTPDQGHGDVGDDQGDDDDGTVDQGPGDDGVDDHGDDADVDDGDNSGPGSDNSGPGSDDSGHDEVDDDHGDDAGDDDHGDDDEHEDEDEHGAEHEVEDD